MARTFTGDEITDEQYGPVLDILLPALGEDPNDVIDHQWCYGTGLTDMPFYVRDANEIGCRIADKYLDQLIEEGKFWNTQQRHPWFHDAIAENRALGPDPWPLAAKIIER
ncbi:hypothetical protein BK816_02700 [Boudabousia tangfeifanii]|uniref:Uncharacterized protein n=1 Tax=Boudabousia tangfeifanii TaxID=1912795 RepID=A0A1D9MJH9_9ACTO|nr:hypothetical protein [Boudabousia tangfeifanii]AOZ72343.1 hypothetical protein BK816_02700 [Boudabousia tangfeifanii]